MADTDDGLKPKQAEAIGVLLVSAGVPQAALKAGVPARTLYRWLAEDPTFVAALKQAEKRTLDGVMRRLTGAGNAAVSVMLQLMTNNAEPPAIRLRAALAVLEQVTRLREQAEIEERLARLEAQISTRTCGE